MNRGSPKNRPKRKQQACKPPRKPPRKSRQARKPPSPTHWRSRKPTSPLSLRRWPAGRPPTPPPRRRHSSHSHCNPPSSQPPTPPPRRGHSTSRLLNLRPSPSPSPLPSTPPTPPPRRRHSGSGLCNLPPSPQPSAQPSPKHTTPTSHQPTTLNSPQPNSSLSQHPTTPHPQQHTTSPSQQLSTPTNQQPTASPSQQPTLPHRPQPIAPLSQKHSTPAPVPPTPSATPSPNTTAILPPTTSATSTKLTTITASPNHTTPPTQQPNTPPNTPATLPTSTPATPAPTQAPTPTTYPKIRAPPRRLTGPEPFSIMGTWHRLPSLPGRTFRDSYNWKPFSSFEEPAYHPVPAFDIYNYGGSNARSDDSDRRLNPDYGRVTHHWSDDTPTAEDTSGVLKVADVDLNVEENAKLHHTDKYEITEKRYEGGEILKPQLVVRRGTPFDIKITFHRKYDESTDDIKLIFDTSDKPLESKGTRVCLIVSDEDKPKEWGAKILKTEGNTVSLRIFTPPNCLVAKWTFKFDTILKEEKDKKVFRYTHPHEIYLLFNPWCPDDQVYMDDEQSRNEYVLNDHGRVYMGTNKQIEAKPWNFGQFEDFMLDCTFYLLDKSELKYTARGNPVLVLRKISAITNSPDDKGVLVGNWSGDYEGGRSPGAWVGSVAILEEYWRTLQPVKFGQCWVFSGLVTSLCRCLGIPARSVTNFASAHDADGSITIDQHWSSDRRPCDSLNEDSVWNFHVWNDVWTARPDLPSGFGGWQAIDATPQETSDGVYQAGPASVEAIKNGLVNLPYDGPFIFAEINADRLDWLMVEDGSWKCVGKGRHSIGKHVSTKNPYSRDRLDVTHMYKFPEGTPQERTAVWRAIAEGSTRKEAYEVAIEDMAFDLIEREDTKLGQPFDVRMLVTNKSKETRNVEVTLTASVVFYTGVPVCQIKSETFSVKAPQATAGEVKMSISVEDYLHKLVDMAQIKISCMAQVMETKQFHCESDDFRLLKPKLNIKVPEQVQVGQQYNVEVSFTNPLPSPLTRAEFMLEGAGLQKPLKIKQTNVPAKKEVKMKTNLTARRVGQRELVVSFDAKEITSVSGHATIHVMPAA